MNATEQTTTEIPSALIDAIANFPTTRTVHHCGESISVSPFDLYVECPNCHSRVKVRAFAGVPELEDVFDAVFAWMNQPGAAEVAEARRQEIADDAD